MSASSSSSKKENSVLVGVRIRPMNESEIKSDMEACFCASEDSSSVQEIQNGEKTKDWPMDYVFGNSCSNAFIFKTFGEPLINKALDGYNAVLFMYGQTSSGKTFTLFGGGSTEGLVGHALEYIYQSVINNQDTEYLIKVSYAELYNEELKDLLSPVPNENLKIIDDPMLGPIIQNITQENFSTAQNVKDLLKEGENRRHFGVTNMNAHSSRSHVLVRLNIESRKLGYKPSVAFRTSWGRDKPTAACTLNLVDLAGSERANKSGTSGQSLKEGSFINKSLLTLGTVISSLSEGKSTSHIPYRDSKLTRLLSSALGGNSQTCLITCISPATGNISESLSTLRFATRAKRIVNHAQKNEFEEAKSLSYKYALQKAELDELREKYEMSKQLGYIADSDVGQTIRAKAFTAQKELKIMKFFLTHTPQIVKELQSRGNYELSKQIQSDLRHVLRGQKNMSETLDDHLELITPHFSENDNFILKIKTLTQINDSDSFDFDINNDKEDINYTEDHIDIVTSSMIDESLLGMYENAQMSLEDIYMKYILLLQTHKLDTSKYSNMETNLSLKLSNLTEKNEEYETRIKTYTKKEAAYLEEIDSIRLNLKKLESSSQFTSDENIKLIKEHEVNIKCKVNEIQSLQSKVTEQNESIEQLKTDKDNLTSQLKQANVLKKSFEDELHKTRADMKMQLDKLRSNMNAMMKIGGEESKVLEIQNADYLREIDALKDELNIAVSEKNHLVALVDELRNDVHRLHESQKTASTKYSSTFSELIDWQKKVQEKEFEISHLITHTKSLETELSELTRRLHDDISRKEEELNILKIDYHDKINKKEETVSSLTLEANSLHEVIENLKSELENKVNTGIASDRHYQHEIIRLENLNSSHSKRIVRIQNEFQDQLRKANDSIIILNKEKHELIAANDILRDKYESLNQSIINFENQLDIEKNDDFVDDYKNSDEISFIPSTDYDDRRDSLTSLPSDNYVRRNSLYNNIPSNRRDSFTSLPSNDYARRNSLSTHIDQTQKQYLDQSSSINLNNNNSTNRTPIQDIYATRRLSLNSKYKANETKKKIEMFFDSASKSRYSSLRHSIELSTASLTYLLSEQISLRSFMIRDYKDINNSLAVYENKLANLQLINNSLMTSKHRYEENINKELEMNEYLQELEEKLKEKSQDLNLKNITLEAALENSTLEVHKLKNELELAQLFVNDAKAIIDDKHAEIKSLFMKNQELESNHKNAIQEIFGLEAKYNRLYDQASIIEKERNEIVQQFIELGY